jgi:hypothetical protein
MKAFENDAFSWVVIGMNILGSNILNYCFFWFNGLVSRYRSNSVIESKNTYICGNRILRDLGDIGLLAT